MDARHEAYLVEHWPEWFDTKGDTRHTLMAYGFQHGNGWFGLVCGLCEQLEPLVRELDKALKPRNERFEVLEVKQKMGELRFYVSHHNEAIDPVIEAARLRSLEMCEVCSRLVWTVELRDHSGWLVTLCDDCEGEDGVPTVVGS